MGATTIPGPVRIAMAVDGGIAAVFVASAVVGLPEGRLGTVLVTAEAGVWAAVLLAWVFPAFWTRWSSAVERLFALRGEDDGDEVRPLADWPTSRSLTTGGAVFATLVTIQAVTSSGSGVAFRSVVASYVVTAGVLSAARAVAADVASLLSATRADD